MKRFLITIDGPAGAGKTTVSRTLAERLGYKYIDTGALYRAVAYEARSQGVDYNDDISLEKLCAALDLKWVHDKNGLRLLSRNSDITDLIRTPEITMLASAVSAKPAVRKCLLAVQRKWGRDKGVIFEGRDMGTVVFPAADIKFFLDASKKTRAHRRYQEQKLKSSQTLPEVEKEMNRRDKNDSSRALAPLKPANDAIIIDSTNLSVDAVVGMMLYHIHKSNQTDSQSTNI